MTVPSRWLLTLLACTALCACGAGDGAGSTAVPPAAPGRGTLVQNPPQLVKLVTAGSLLLELSIAVNQPLLAQSGTPLCDIAVHKLLFRTVGGANEATESSAALMVPSGLDARCRGDRPILMYAHGTSSEKAFDMTHVDDGQNSEALIVAAVFAAQGYIVVAPNYAGYDTSTLGYHPFLNADQQSKEMIDALAAARSALPTLAAPLTRDGGKLYLTGYSQGGHVTMATHRAMQAAGIAVTASAPLSGPYAMAAFTDAVFGGEVNGSAPLLLAMLLTSWQKSYSNLYASVNDVYEAQYAGGIEALLPSTLARSELYAQGKLPRSVLFSATPPDPQFAAMTPATAPQSLAALFAQGFGAGNLIRNSFRLSYLLDAQANPDGGWPTLGSGLPAATPANPLRQAAKRNDLRDWVPTAPLLLCGGNGDPTVFWLNTQLMQNYWLTHTPAANTVAVLDVDSQASANDPYRSIKADFALAKLLVAATAVAQGATDGGAQAVLEAYHSTLVPPFCLSAARDFFAAH